MARSFAKKFYNSTKWKKARRGYIAKVNGICEHCGRPGYIVDHKTELTPENIDDVNITLNEDNFQYLCLECHNKKTFQRYLPTQEGMMFDEEGNLIKIPPLK